METQKYKKEIERELAIVEKELKTVGRKNPGNPADWEATPLKLDTLKSDDGEVAENIEAFEGNTAILKELEIRYNILKNAHKRIADGTFGICKICKKTIETKRLEANAGAETCIAHLKE